MSAPQEKALQYTLPMSPKTPGSDRGTDNFSCSTFQYFVSYLLPWDTEMAELLKTNDQKRENTKKTKNKKNKQKKIKAILYFKFMNIFLTMTQTWGIVFIWYVQSTWIILL